ncbi:MAG: metallophosphoesterase [Arenicellales bacterium]|nr:metallophosphoesterase [Arenicellales bacterium]
MYLKVAVRYLLIGVVFTCVSRAADVSHGPTATVSSLKVAFIADTGTGQDFRKVLQLIKNQQTDMVMHQGDLGYSGSHTTRFMNAVNEVLGSNFPYFASRGNHDLDWEQSYQPILKQRAEAIGVECTGNYGQNSACTYQGLFFILSAGGETQAQSENAQYIREQLAADNSIWRVCSWHRNQKTLQIERKSSEVGWGLYEACREGGAIIATGHGHSYARTRTLKGMKDLSIDPDCDTPEGNKLCVTRRDDARGKPGSTFAFISGLGGKSRRSQVRCTPTIFPFGQGRGCRGIWASIYSTKQNAEYGALFITFNVDGDPTKAVGEFINIHGEVIDSFTITATRTGKV